MYDLGLGWRLPEYIGEFLKYRRFCIAVHWSLSGECAQEAGVPQGSILPVTLFAIKINSLVMVIPPKIHSSPFVGDVQVAYSDYDIQKVLKRLQHTVNRMSAWANTNAFKFSIARTRCIVFHPKQNYPLALTLHMNGHLLPVRSLMKFHGLYGDPQLTWKLHISKLKTACNTSFSKLRMHSLWHSLVTSLATPFTKATINFHLIFREYVYTEYQEYSQLYTGGSKDDEGVGAAAVFGLDIQRATPISVASVYTAEMHALMMACNLIAYHQRDNNKYFICTDSLSAAQGLWTMDPRNHFMHRLQVRVHHLLLRGLVITILWTPSHMGIPRNKLGDQAAKSASSDILEFIYCRYTDWMPYIKRAIYTRWRKRWHCGNRHMSPIRNSPGSRRKLVVTREEVLINSLRVGHEPYALVYYGACASATTSLPLVLRDNSKH